MGKTHRKSIIKEALERLDSKMAIGESRRAAKQAAREEAGGEHIWSFSTGKIHSYKTRTTYQEHILRFIHWARRVESIKSLDALDARADQLATAYLMLEVESRKSPYTLQVERSALRLFFDNRDLASEVTLPRRERAHITRSRGPAVRDRHFQPANWPDLMTVERAFGLRRSELARLTVADIYHNHQAQLVAHVKSGKGGREREAPVLPGRELDVLAVVAGRKPEERVVDHVPSHADIHALRREYAQALYLHHAPGRNLPPAAGRLRLADYDKEAALEVSRALGHNRLDVVLRHYIR